jgi:hypothetical protein
MHKRLLVTSCGINMKNDTVLEVGGRRTQVYLPIQGAPLHNFKDYDHLTTTVVF